MSAEFPPQSLRAIAGEVAQLLKDTAATVAIAETAAGGLISSSLLSIPGTSKIYAGGLTLYTLPSRIAYAGWTDINISSYTGPSPNVVSEIAQNVHRKLRSTNAAQGTVGPTYTLCESGTAGPTASGKGRNRQPGYCAFAIVRGEEAEIAATMEIEPGSVDRAANMVSFAQEGLGLLKKVIQEQGIGEARL